MLTLSSATLASLHPSSLSALVDMAIAGCDGLSDATRAVPAGLCLVLGQPPTWDHLRRVIAGRTVTAALVSLQSLSQPNKAWPPEALPIFTKSLQASSISTAI